MNTVPHVKPEPEATLHVFPVSPQARMRLAMRNLETVLEEQRRHVAGMRVALGVVSKTQVRDEATERLHAGERAARP